MKRCYSKEFYSDKKNFIISESAEVHHLRNVLRIKTGDQICILNGQGDEGEGKVNQISMDKIEVEIQVVRKNILPKPYLILACAVPKRSKFELIVEKATELGVSEIVPVLTQRTEFFAKNKEEAAHKKISRYQAIAINAAKQCQRATIPHIHSFMAFKDVILMLKTRSMLVIPSLQENRQPLLKVFEQSQKVAAISFFIGPEGDFTSDEYNYATENGAKAVTLGPTVLRVETAAITVLAAANIYFYAGE